MVISPRTHSIFIHIQKTGGSSIEQALRKADPDIGTNLYDGRRHIGAQEFRGMVSPEIWKSYLKFAFVRNPWDRLVSWHSMCMATRNGNKFSALVKSKYPDFADFVRDGECCGLSKTSQNQLDFVTDDRGMVIVDFIGRFENLADDFNKLGLANSTLPHINKTFHRDYRLYYTDELREMVERRFHKDCSYFGYRFE